MGWWFHRVSKDDYLNMLLALRQLRRLGYRRIGLAIPAPINHRVDLRYGAAYLAYQEHFRVRQPVPLLTLESIDQDHLTK